MATDHLNTPYLISNEPTNEENDPASPPQANVLMRSGVLRWCDVYCWDKNDLVQKISVVYQVLQVMGKLSKTEIMIWNRKESSEGTNSQSIIKIQDVESAIIN